MDGVRAAVSPGGEDPAEGSDGGSASEDAIGPDGTVTIRKPGVHDVLLGRGGGTNNHTGNVKFRQLVKDHKMRYLACSKVEKPKVAREVVELWRKLDPPGRFLSRQESPTKKTGPGSTKDSNNIWVEVSEKKAREKASQCLRERTEDVIPYLSKLRQQQDKMTEQGVTQVQRKMQMEQENNTSKTGMNSPYTSPTMARDTRKKSESSNLPDHNPSSTAASMVDRRMSLPVVSSSSKAVPASPAANTSSASRRTSLPPVNQMQEHQMKMNMQILAQQQEMMHKQQVLREAYTVIERSNGAPMHSQQNMAAMQQAMSHQHLLAERQAMMQQQYSNFGDSPMTSGGGITPQEQQMMMMQHQQQHMMAQQQAQAMGRGRGHGMMHSGALHPQGMDMSMNNHQQMANLNAGMHNMNMDHNMNVMSNQQIHQMQSPQQRGMMGPGFMPGMEAPGMNGHQSPRQMRGGQQQQQDPRGSPTMSDQLNGNNIGFHEQQQQQRQRRREKTIQDIDEQLSTADDFEPLPAYEGDDGHPRGSPSSANHPSPDDQKSSNAAPPRFVSPIIDKSNQKGLGASAVNDKFSEDHQQASLKDMSSSTKQSSSPKSSKQGKPAAAAAVAKKSNDEDEDVNPLPVDNGVVGDEGNSDGKISSDVGKKQSDSDDKGGHDRALKEYRKTLESYISNHQISTPAVDINDDASDDDDEGGGGARFEGIDASEWIQNALNDSGDMSLQGRSKHLANARRALLKEHGRDNSKKSLMSADKSLMSIGTGFGGNDSMSIAFSDMEECSLPLKDHSGRDAPRRGSFSNRSISSELTDFSDLDGL